MADDDDTGFIAKLIMSGVVIAASTLTEIGTGPAPIGSMGAIIGLALIWGFEDEADQLEEAT